MKYIADILAEVTTWCNHDPIITIRYGALYNWNAATDAREIANTDWHVPSKGEFDIMLEYIDDYDVVNNYYPIAGSKLKYTGNQYWDENIGATNEVKFNARGAGFRSSGDFMELNYFTYFFTTTEYDWESAYSLFMYGGDLFAQWEGQWNAKDNGCSIRLVKDITSLAHGQTGTYTGNDGKVYGTICIGTQEYLADNLCETKYRNGDDIPEVTINAAWVGLATGARCYYNNNITNA